MSTTFKVICVNCGDIILAPDDIEVVYRPRVGKGEYAFLCPQCKTLQTKPANEKILDVLSMARVPAKVGTHCSNCRDMHITPGNIVGVVHNPATASGEYMFRCPECNNLQKEKATEDAVDFMVKLQIPLTLQLTEEEISSFAKELKEEQDVIGRIRQEDLADNR